VVQAAPPSPHRKELSMNAVPRLRRWRLAIGALALTLALVGVPHLAHATPALPPNVPSTLQVPAGNVTNLVGHATGTQNYACTAGATGNVWTFVGPQATLVGNNGHVLALHFAVPGSNPPVPEWQATDGSSVVGHKVAGVTVDPTAIPWLLLSAASTSLGPEGGDRLAATTYIQRLNTTGGLAPTSACTVGDTANVPYTADYYFSQAAG
jgi:hypothetical protein